MAIEKIAEKSLEEIRSEKERELAKDAQLQWLGVSLTEEKLKNAQKDEMLANLGREVPRMKLEILELKGVEE